MIKLNVAEIKKTLVGESSFHYELRAADLNIKPEDLRVQDTIYVDGLVANGGDVILLKAHLRTKVKRQCGRCLKEFVAVSEADVDERFYPAETEGLEIDAFTYQFDIVDITEVLREGLLLAEPITVLCKKDCKGLCPVCGVDRNVTECHCETRAIDPRLIALQELLHKQIENYQEV